MTWHCGSRGILSALGIVLALATSAAAQANDEVFPQFKWNFSTPGARANGMGATFIGIADDATATVTNPAGLVRLTRPQVYFEYKQVNLEVDRLASVDAFFSRQPTTFSSDVGSLSFLSVSAPLGDRISVGLARHEFLNYEESFDLAPRGFPSGGGASNFALFPVHGVADFQGAAYAGTVSVALTSQLDIGLTLAYNQLNAASTATRFDFNFGPDFPDNLTDLTETDVIANQTSIDEDDSSMTFGFGTLFRPHELVSFGFNFVQGPSFEVSEDLQVNPGFPIVTLPLEPVDGFPRTVAINVPDRVGFGIAVRPSPRLLVALDVVRIGYSSLVDDFTLIFGDDVLLGTEYSIEDVTEVHVGAEYNVMTGRNPVFVRAGFYTDPDHSVRFTEILLLPLNVLDANNAIYNSLPREGENRGTVGAGFAAGLNFQIDLAYVFGREFVASAALRF